MFLRVIAVTMSLPFPHWHQAYIKNLIAKSFVHCLLCGSAFVPRAVLWGTGTCGDGAVQGACVPAPFLQQNEGWERNRNFG